jgi:hypothetical protein
MAEWSIGALNSLLLDLKSKKYICKRIWSYGFIENGRGYWEDNLLVFQLEFDNEPEYFAGMCWQSFIKKYGENEIGTGLLTSKEGEEYRLYSEARLTQVEK